MRHRHSAGKALGVVAALLAGAGPTPVGPAVLSGQQPAQETVRVFQTDDAFPWRPAPTGAWFANLHGDPSRAGPFAFRMRMPAGFRMAPHLHDAAEHLSVLSGTLFMAFAEDGDAEELAAGSFVSIPSGTPMWGWTADEETVIQIHGDGPFRTTRLTDARPAPSGDPGAASAEPPSLAGESRSEAFAAMDSVYRRFIRAYALGEPDSVIVLYTDAPLYLPGSGDIRQGVDELGAEFGFLRGLREAEGVPRIQFESIERDASGDLAYDVGYYRLQVELADGSTLPETRGKFTTFWRRGSDGSWRIHVDSFSPAPEQR